MSDSTDPGRTGDGFEDPTAPTWTTPDPAPPTQPIPTEPPVATPSPYSAPQPGPGVAPDPYVPAVDPYAPAPYGQNPYGQPYDPAAYGQTPYGQPPVGSTAYGQPPYSLPPAPYGAPPAKNTSAIVLTVVSVLALIACCNVLAIPSLVLGIMGISKSAHDPQGAARATRAGWITFAVTTTLVVLGWVVFFVLLASGTFDGNVSYDYQQL